MSKEEIGMLAKSKAGHDKDRVYIIIEVDEAYVYLADGVIRTIDSPKRKKRKHVQLIHKKHDMTAMDDVKIKRILKNFEKEEMN